MMSHSEIGMLRSVAICIDKVEEEEITRILATVNMKYKSQKGVLLWKSGAMMKAINSAARQQMQKLVAE